MRGVPVWATLIALQEDGVVTAGLVSAPALGRRWWASRGAGAHTGGALAGARRLQVSRVGGLPDASVAYSSLTGWDEQGRLPGLLRLSERRVAHPGLRRLLVARARGRGRGRRVLRARGVAVGHRPAAGRRRGGRRPLHRPGRSRPGRTAAASSARTGGCTTRVLDALGRPGAWSARAGPPTGQAGDRRGRRRSATAQTSSSRRASTSARSAASCARVSASSASSRSARSSASTCAAVDRSVPARSRVTSSCSTRRSSDSSTSDRAWTVRQDGGGGSLGDQPAVRRSPAPPYVPSSRHAAQARDAAPARRRATPHYRRGREQSPPSPPDGRGPGAGQRDRLRRHAGARARSPTTTAPSPVGVLAVRFAPRRGRAAACWPGRSASRCRATGDSRALALLGGVGYVGQALCYFTALERISAGLTALLLTSSRRWSWCCRRVLLRERPRPLAVGCVGAGPGRHGADHRAGAGRAGQRRRARAGRGPRLRASTSSRAAGCAGVGRARDGGRRADRGGRGTTGGLAAVTRPALPSSATGVAGAGRRRAGRDRRRGDDVLRRAGPARPVRHVGAVDRRAGRERRRRRRWCSASGWPATAARRWRRRAAGGRRAGPRLGLDRRRAARRCRRERRASRGRPRATWCASAAAPTARPRPGATTTSARRPELQPVLGDDGYVATSAPSPVQLAARTVAQLAGAGRARCAPAWRRPPTTCASRTPRRCATTSAVEVELRDARLRRAAAPRPEPRRAVHAAGSRHGVAPPPPAQQPRRRRQRRGVEPRVAAGDAARRVADGDPAR